jgi:hypothetical protein
MSRMLCTFSCFLMLTVIFVSKVPAQAEEQPKPPVEKQQQADQPPADPCPKIDVKAPNQPIRDGVPVKISANLAGGDKKVSPMFDWSISAGVISSGQGTPSIEIDTTGAGSERMIYATVLLGGFAPECMSSGTATVTVAGPAQKVDEFGVMPEAELSQRLTSFLGSVAQTDQAYIFAYAGRTNVRGFASSSLRQIRAEALKTGIPSERLITIDGGYRDDAGYELWIVPIGSEAPRPSPTVSARDIVFPKAPAPARKRP